MPTINVSRTRKAIMNSLTRNWITSQAETIESNVRRVESRTKNSEIPSIPMW